MLSYIKDLSDLCSELKCSFIPECSLREYNTFRIGGKCQALVSINSVNSLVRLLSFLKGKNINYQIIGRGSNIIVSDKGYEGVILLIGGDFSDIKITGNKVICQSGAKLSSVCLEVQKHGLSGMENLYGIPGTVGGALYMNAGAYGTEISDVIESAEYLDSDGNIYSISESDMNLSYRHSIFSEKDRIIISAVFRLEKGEPEKIKSAMNECIAKRREKQPLEYPSAGSTFKRPQGSYASLLIEQCGLKGLSCGDAEVSTKHCGFVINKGNASCSDVLELCGKVKSAVKEKTGYILELEPIIIGNL